MSAITISKQLGAGGEDIARLVCDMLRYRYFDKQLIIAAARDVGLAHDQVVDYSEDRYEVQNFLARVLGRGPRPVKKVKVHQPDAAGAMTLTETTIDEGQYVELIQSAIRAAHAEGDIVIVGRGGQSILQDEPNVLHVRVIAPQGTRIARVQERSGCSMDEAQMQIARQDRATSEYLGRFFGVHCDDPDLYHFVLNTGKLSLEGAAQIVVDAVVQLRASIAG
jgi:cytidylate kinase